MYQIRNGAPFEAHVTPPASPVPKDRLMACAAPRIHVSKAREFLLTPFESPATPTAPYPAPPRPAPPSSLVRGLDCEGPTLIRPYLYVGGIDNARNRMSLYTLEVTHILSAAAEYPPAGIPGIESLHVPLFDRTNERAAVYFCDVIAWIDRARSAGGRVLVHCQHGVSRSITMVLAYLMQAERLTLAQALQSVKAQRPTSEPNIPFLRDLRDHERAIFGEVTSTQPLTLLDPGLVDLASSDEQSYDILQQCLAAANRDQDPQMRQAREQHAAQLMVHGDNEQTQALIATNIMRSFESFGGAALRDQAARLSLYRILHLLSQNDEHSARGVQHVLQTLPQTDDWQVLTMDVPLARKFLHEMKIWLQQQAA